MKLIPLKYCINKDLYNMYRNIPKEELGSYNKMNGVSYEEFNSICDEYIKEETIKNEKLDTTTQRYILKDNDELIGEVGIRTTLNDYWTNRGSQIFYKLRIDKRGIGYGNEILRLALEEARKLGFDKIRINCDDRNIPSKKVILNNGGVVDIEGYYTNEGKSSSYVIKL